MGYGSRALQALNAYYSGEYFNVDEAEKAEEAYPDPTVVAEVSVPALLYYVSSLSARQAQETFSVCGF